MCAVTESRLGRMGLLPMQHGPVAPARPRQGAAGRRFAPVQLAVPSRCFLAFACHLGLLLLVSAHLAQRSCSRNAASGAGGLIR